MDNELKYLIRFSELYSHPAIILWRSIEAKCLSQVLKQINFNNSTFDLGCGEGKVSTIILDQPIDVGLDINKAEVTKAKLTESYKNLIVGDGRSLPFADESFGLVFSNCVIEHILEIKNVLKEVSRVLKAKGYFIFTVPSENFGDFLFFTNLFNNLGLRKLAHWYAIKRNKLLNHYNIFSEEIWTKKLRDLNLEVVFAQQYLSKSVMEIWDLLAFLGFLWRKLGLTKLQRFIKLTSKFNRIKIRIYTRILRKYYESQQSDIGGGLLIVAQR